MAAIHSFPPIGAPSAQVLVLGSMPGEASLKAGQYYAHPRNWFWKILGELLGIDPDGPYDVRIDSLIQRRIALWDVLQSCSRKGSLDSAIQESSILPNPLGEYLRNQPAIGHVFFNGAKAEAAYSRYVLPTLSVDRPIRYRRLPSTSPANARIPYTEKLQAWRSIFV